MIRRLTLTLALTLATAAGVGAPARAEAQRVRPPSCLTSGTTIDANVRARLFRVGDVTENALYVCWRANRHVLKLGNLGFDDVGPTIPVLSGRYVAYDYQICDREEHTCVGTIHVRDAQTGRRTHIASGQGGQVTQLVLDTHGNAAWIRDSSTSLSPLVPTALYTLNSHGVTTTLDANPGLDSTSLAAIGSRIYWLDTGLPMTATLV